MKMVTMILSIHFLSVLLKIQFCLAIFFSDFFEEFLFFKEFEKNSEN